VPTYFVGMKNVAGKSHFGQDAGGSQIIAVAIVKRDRHGPPRRCLAGRQHALQLQALTPARRTVAITFDDCYRDNLAAARVLAEHGLPATFFISDEYVGTDHVFPWDADLKKMPNLSWKDVHEMQQLGHENRLPHRQPRRLGVISRVRAHRELAARKRRSKTGCSARSAGCLSLRGP